MQNINIIFTQNRNKNAKCLITILNKQFFLDNVAETGNIRSCDHSTAYYSLKRSSLNSKQYIQSTVCQYSILNILPTQPQTDKYASRKIYYIRCKKNADAAINAQRRSIAWVNMFHLPSADNQPDHMRSKQNQNSRERLQKDSCISHGFQSTSCVLPWRQHSKPH